MIEELTLLLQWVQETGGDGVTIILAVFIWQQHNEIKDLKKKLSNCEDKN